MRTLRTLFLLATAAVITTSCAGAPPRYVSTQHSDPRTVALWVDERAGLSLQGALDGCKLWNEEDIRCVAAANPLEADVIIVLDNHPCSPDKEGKVILAHADAASVIGVRLDCFYPQESSGTGEFNAEEYRLVLAHELGHEFGIWDHVPKECEERPPSKDGKDPGVKLKQMPDGRKVCGAAIMNPECDVSLKALTPSDDMAFRLRDRVNNVLPGNADAHGTLCNYVKKIR